MNTSNDLLQCLRGKACVAYRYCAALQAYDVGLPGQGLCYFVQPLAPATIDPATEDQVKLHDTNSGLLQKLLQSAASRLASTTASDAAQTQFEALTVALDARFDGHMTLWQAMIAAARANRAFTDDELDYYEQGIAEARGVLIRMIRETDKDVALAATSAHDRRLKQLYGLQFDEQMIADINRLVGNILTQQPTLIVGDKGIAKTQVARFVAGLFGSEPIVVSVKGDMMSDELIGSIKHDRATNSFVFEEGVLLAAMRKGLPILLDEVNFGDQAIIARMQDILLRKAGDTVSIQESSSTEVVVQPGFCVFATANEASQRYRHREILDPAIRDRFDIIMRSYPDIADDPVSGVPANLMRLAMSSAVDDWGTPSKHIDLGLLEAFVKLAHATQYLYSVPAKDIVLELEEDRMTSSVLEESQPLMSDCITPRTLSNTIARCAAGNLPDVRLDAGLVDRMVHSLDQAGSSQNAQLAEQVKVLLDIGYDIDFAKETARRVGSSGIDAAADPPFAGLSDEARQVLLSGR